MSARSVARIIPAARTVEGGGFVVYRAFPTPALDHVDPFLLIDELGPVDYRPGEAVGAPAHPHRGFEAVTYVLAGALVHRDSAGHSGSLDSGDLQWMTAGAGLVHAEMPSDAVMRDGGRMHGIQLWVNLPRVAKMLPPSYQQVRAAEIPEAGAAGLSVKVVAGRHAGVSGPINTQSPILYLHVRLEPGATFEHLLPATHNALAYVIEGSAFMGVSRLPASRRQMPLFAHDGDRVGLVSGDQGAELLVLAGAPLDEPIARYGPFVMNTREEILETLQELRQGTFIRG